MVICLFIVGCICFLCGVIGINTLTAAFMIRDLYLNGTYMKAIDVMERTGTIMLLKIDVVLVLIGMTLMLLTFVIKTSKKS